MGDKISQINDFSFLGKTQFHQQLKKYPSCKVNI